MMPSAISGAEHQMLAADLGGFTRDPLGAVLYGFPWGTGELDGIDGPRAWQREVLDFVGQWFSNGLKGADRERFGSETRSKVCRIAVSSGNGPGKSTLAALLAWWADSTFEDCRINVTANTKNQLDTKTSPEFAKWFRQCINADWFEVNVTSIKVKEESHAKNWRIDFLPWSDANPAATAGQHNKGKRLVLVFDEGSEIADIIYETAEGALTDEDTEIIWLLLGNPTRNNGAFYDAVFGRMKHRWKSWVLDSRKIEGTNKAQIAEWEQDYGEDSDWFRVHVRGLPPRAASAQYIDMDLIQTAQKRMVKVLDDEPLVAGVDFAWGGADENVVRFRCGQDARSIPAVRIKGEFTRDPAVMTGKLADVLTRSYTIGNQPRRVAMLFLDSAGIAAPIEDRLRKLGHKNIMVVNFGAHSPDTRYAFMRDYMWGKLKEWLATGGIDRDPGLEADLSGPCLVSDRQQRVKLEAKELMMKRGLPSPDDGDALALTFAMPVALPKPRARAARPFTAMS
jgi:hypothetical protein